MKKIDIHLHAALDPVPGTEKFKISTGEEMLAHLEELQIEKAIVMSSGETEGAMASVSGNQKCRELARRFPEKYGRQRGLHITFENVWNWCNYHE